MRNLSLAVFAALALTAMLGAAGASASGFAAGKYPATITSSSEGGQTLRGHGFTASCTPPSIWAEFGGQSNAIEVSPSSTTCEMLGLEQPLTMNGCGFVYRPGAETSPGVFGGTFDITCPGAAAIQYGSGPGTCIVTIPAQSGLKATYKNVGSGSTATVSVTPAATGLKHTQVSGWACSPPGTYSDGEWNGASWKLQASNEGVQTGLSITNKNPIQIKKTGAEPPKLVASGGYPVSISSTLKKTHTFALQYGNVTCSTTTLSSSASKATAELVVQSENSGCLFAGLAASINMNGCTYLFKVLPQEPVGSIYAGHADIACPGGKAIEIVAPKTGKVRCTVTIGAQTTDSEGLTFENELLSSTIALGLAVKGIDYHQQAGEAGGSCTTGDFTTGTYTGASTLIGSY